MLLQNNLKRVSCCNFNSVNAFKLHFDFSISYTDLISERRTKSKYAEAPTSPTQVFEPEAVSEQHISDSPVAMTKQAISEEPLNIGFDQSSEADIPIQFGADFSTPKDDRSLFPEISPSISTVKTIDHPEMVIEGAGPNPAPSVITSRTEVL